MAPTSLAAAPTGSRFGCSAISSSSIPARSVSRIGPRCHGARPNVDGETPLVTQPVARTVPAAPGALGGHRKRLDGGWRSQHEAVERAPRPRCHRSGAHRSVRPGRLVVLDYWSSSSGLPDGFGSLIEFPP